jgi:hypothetical protein
MEKDIIGRGEEVTTEGVVDTIIKGVSDVKKMFRPLNISTTERLLNFVSELNKFNSDKRTSFALHMQLGSYGEEKILKSIFFAILVHRLLISTSMSNRSKIGLMRPWNISDYTTMMVLRRCILSIG